MARPRGVVVYVLNYDIVVSEFELQSRCKVKFVTNTLRKSINIIIYPAMG